MTEVYSNGTGEFPAPGNGLVEDAPSEKPRAGNKPGSSLNTLNDAMKAWLWPEVKKYVTRDKETGVYGLKGDMSHEDLAKELTPAFWVEFPFSEHKVTLTATNIRSALIANKWYTFREDMPLKPPKAPLRDSAATRIAALEKAHNSLVEDVNAVDALTNRNMESIHAIEAFLDRKYGESWRDPE